MLQDIEKGKHDDEKCKEYHREYIYDKEEFVKDLEDCEYKGNKYKIQNLVRKIQIDADGIVTEVQFDNEVIALAAIQQRQQLQIENLQEENKMLRERIEMKDRCPKPVGDAKQTLEIRVSQKEASKHTDENKSIDVLVVLLCMHFYYDFYFLKDVKQGLEGNVTVGSV